MIVRAQNIARYCERLVGTSYTLPVNSADYDWLAMPLMHRDRKSVLRFLESNDVQVSVCVCVLCVCVCACDSVTVSVCLCA